MNPLKFSQLLINNKAVPRSFTITALEGSTRIELYDVIDSEYGVSATTFVTALNNIKDSEISLHINSPGGCVFSARAMVAAIAAHPSNITAYIDGLAASAASYVAMACDKVAINNGSLIMVHCASTLLWGNASDMQETASLLSKIDDSIAADYARKTGKPVDEMLALMAKETWLDSAEALAMGFVDSIIENEKGKAKPTNQWDLSVYANSPAKPAPEPEPIHTITTEHRARQQQRLQLANHTTRQ